MLQSPRLVRHCAWVIRHETLIKFITIIIIIVISFLKSMLTKKLRNGYNTASIQLCGLCVWTKAPLDIFFKNSARHSPFSWTARACLADLLVPAITEHVTTQEERDLLELPVRLGGLGLVNPARTASQEYEASVKITGPLVRQIVKQAHEPQDETETKTLQARECTKRKRWIVEDAVWASEGILA